MLQPVYIARSTPQDCGERFIKHRRAAEITSTPPQRNAVPQRYDHWVAEIHRLLGSERAGTIDLARLLYEARRELRGGEWSTLWRGRWIPFSKRKSDMLVTIGRELGNLDEQNLAQLPLHWSVLYEVALLGTARVVALIGEGVIHPILSLREAAQLRTKQVRKQDASIEKAIRRLEEMVRHAGPRFSQSRRVACAAVLNRLAADILAETKEGTSYEIEDYRRALA